MKALHIALQRKREEVERFFEHKKVQLDNAKKISASNSHEPAVDTTE
jgi:hypothetical protein